MGFFRQLAQMLQAEIKDIINEADDPVETARSLVQEFEDEIARQRGKLVALENREATTRRAHRQAQDSLELWNARAQEAADKGDTRGRERALQRREGLLASVREAEVKWWEASSQAEEMRRCLNTLEDKAQQARRQKDSLLTLQRRERSSSEFIALPAGSHSVLCHNYAEVEEELQRLRGKEAQERCEPPDTPPADDGCQI